MNFGAVIKLRRTFDNELFKFIEFMKDVGFLKRYAEHFEKTCCYDEFNEFSEDKFWYYVKINGGNTHDTCIEFQWSKGFTWGDRKDYLNYNGEMKILNIDELIKACNKEYLFKMNYEYTSFKNELQSQESISDLDDFLAFYDWSITKYSDGKYNIKDEQCNTFDFENNTTFDEILKRVYFRMFDYFTDEEDIEELMEEDYEYVKKKFDSYIKTGENLNLLDEESKKYYTNWFEETVKENMEKNALEMDIDI